MYASTRGSLVPIALSCLGPYGASLSPSARESTPGGRLHCRETQRALQIGKDRAAQSILLFLRGCAQQRERMVGRDDGNAFGRCERALARRDDREPFSHNCLECRGAECD